MMNDFSQIMCIDSLIDLLRNPDGLVKLKPNLSRKETKQLLDR